MPDVKKLKLRSVNELSLSYNNISSISLDRLSRTIKVCNSTVFYIRIIYIKREFKETVRAYTTKMSSKCLINKIWQISFK
jgi:hypothetical protein